MLKKLPGITSQLSAQAGAPDWSRLLSVLSWGRNVEGQCGVESAAVVTRPTPILELHGAPVVSLHAGKLDSAAVTQHGDAWTWGDGKAGKLGQGSADSVFTPSRVEALVGRTHVSNLALGDQHTLFLDNIGGVWSCGENKEGQCGLGTPIEVIASQHRRSYYESLRPSREARSGDKFSRYLKSLVTKQEDEHRHRHAFGSSGNFFMSNQSSGVSWQHHGSGGGMSQEGARLALGFGGLDMEGHIHATGLQPGQLHTPTRIGRDQHPLMSFYHQAQPGSLRVVTAAGLENESVLGVSASRYFSLAVTDKGEVWTFGACYNGSLGSHSSWSTSAQKISGCLAQSVADNGGAIQVAAGGTFCMALTATGKVLVWGKMPGSEQAGSELMQVAGGASITIGQRLVVGELPDLPPIRHIAAGQQHGLVTDGERVWMVGKAMSASGQEMATHPWNEPKEVLRVPAEGIKSVHCGSHSSAAVTDDGQLYMWGRLLDSYHADSLIKRYGSRMSHFQDVMPEDVRWKWAGFGASEPALVEGLAGVKAVALGGWHAMVLTE